MTAILIPTLIIQVLMSDVMELNSDTVPNVPACFCENTIIVLNDKSKVKISDIQVGDVIHDGSKVTCKMVLSSYRQEMCKLGDTFVTGHHTVYHEEKGWIPVDQHPNCKVIDEFNDPFLYCINTDTKYVKIGKYTYSDWDDLDDEDLAKLRNNCSDLVPNTLSQGDIHHYLDAGFHEDMKIELKNGKVVSIPDVKVNDVLRNGERVCGVVQVDCKDVASGVSDYCLNNSMIRCTSNVIVINNESGEKTPIKVSCQNNMKPDYVYHLLTDSG